MKFKQKEKRKLDKTTNHKVDEEERMRFVWTLLGHFESFRSWLINLSMPLSHFFILA